jgi:hypothetical protein
MKQYLILVLAVLCIIGCKKKDDPCTPIAITTTKKDANLGQSNGSIIVTNPKGTNYQYSINGGAYQADTIFSNLVIGSYTVNVKDSKNCTGTATVNLVDPCNGVTTFVSTSKVDAITGQTNGSITVTNPVGSGITYSIGASPYQSSTNFNNLGAGTYTINVKTAAGCNGSTTATITGYGPKYYLVKTIIQGYCGPCHLNGGTSGNVSFDTDAAIVAKWDRIKARAVDNLPSVMPQGGPLTAADKAKITDWVNAGHTVNN